MIESLLLSTVRISTFAGNASLTNATGFFFRRDTRLFLISSRHVFIDEASNHCPDRVSIDLHTDASNLAAGSGYGMPLYDGGQRLWRETSDAAGLVDVAALEIDQAAFPANAVISEFGEHHISGGADAIEIGTDMLIVGFPLGFQDTLHRLPVVRHAINASTTRFRFQGQGYFLTDARTHRGSSGACVVVRSPGTNDPLPWKLIGIHSARLDHGSRDIEVDEALGLNCAWFADALLPLTAA